MFIYEKKITVDAAEVECLNVVFGATQIPATAPDVQIYKDASDVIHVKVGDNDYTSATE